MNCCFSCGSSAGERQIASKRLAEFDLPSFDAFSSEVGSAETFRADRILAPPYAAVDAVVFDRNGFRFHGRIKADDIKAITIDSYWVAKRYTDSERAASLWNPQTRETADHSIVWLVAAVLLDGNLTAESFEETRIRDPRLIALMKKITIRENSEYTAAYPSRWPCTIEIEAINDVSKLSIVHEIDRKLAATQRFMQSIGKHRVVFGNQYSHFGYPVGSAGLTRRQRALQCGSLPCWQSGRYMVDCASVRRAMLRCGAGSLASRRAIKL